MTRASGGIPGGVSPQAFSAMARAVDLLTQGILGLKRRVMRAEAVEAVRAAGREPRMPIEFRSQFGEDLWLWDLFEGKLDGRFIEVGAFDGYHLSVSYAFEAVGWTGVLIEPGPEACEACRQRRKASRVVHAALSRRGSRGTAAFTVAPRFGTLSYLTASREHQQEVHQREGGSQRRVEVPLMSMDDVLGDDPGPIDFAVIDVEGGEADLLEGFSLERYRPRVVMIEEGFERPSSPYQKRMTEAGYAAAAYVAINRVFVRADDAVLLERARELPGL
jgi:FkbM family methyltransferase